MPDQPGVATQPDPAPGQAALNALQAGGATTPVMGQFKSDRTAVLQRAGYDKEAIDKYWGDNQPPSSIVQDNTRSNIAQATQGQPDAVHDLLSDPVKYLSAAAGSVWSHYQPYFQSEMAKGQQQGADARAHFAQIDLTPGDQAPDDFSNIAHAGVGTLGILGAGFTEAAAPFAAAIDEGPGKALASVPLPGQVYNAKTGKTNFGLTHVDEDTLGSAVTTTVGFLIGGDHMAEPASLPESTRAAAMDAHRVGQLPDGPAGLVDQVAGRSMTPDQAIAIHKVVPGSRDFVSAAADLVGPPTPESVRSGAIARVTKTLQDIYTATGMMPQEIADKAKADPIFRQEVFQQDIRGDAVAPHYASARPPQPPPIRRGTSVEGTEVFQNSVPTAMEILREDEGSGANATSYKGARGTYQIMPATAAQYGFDPAKLYDPAYNKVVAQTITSDLYQRFHGDMEAMSIAYNGGPGRANEWLRAGPGSRLEAVRDNNMRTGWRYDRVASQRDESFLPTETQEYVARTRYRMGKPEPNPTAEDIHDGGPRVVHEAGTTRNPETGEREPYEFEPEEGEETPVSSGRGSGGAASAWDDERPVDDAYEELQSNVGEQRDTGAPKGLSAYDRFITNFMSRVQPAKAADDVLAEMGASDPAKDYGIADAFSQVTKSVWRAQIAANEGPVEWGTAEQRWNVDREGPTAKAALTMAEKNGGNTQDFMTWLVARRVGVLEDKGVNSGFNVQAAARIMRDPEEAAKYKDAAKLWDGYNDKVLDYAQKAGRYSVKQIAAMKKVGAWVSFRRLMGDDASFALRGKNFAIGNPLRRMEGSDRQIVDPLLASLDNNAMTFKSADANMATGMLVKWAEQNPKFATLLGLRRVGIDALPGADAIDKALAAYGIPEDQLEEAREAFGTLLQDRAGLKGNQFPYFRDGQREVWESAWPELANMIRGSSPVQAGLITQIFQGIATAVRAGVVAIPDFAIRTFASHQMIQFINNPLHPPPFLTGFNGLVKGMGMHDLMVDAMANGALGTSMEAMDRTALYETMNNVLGKTGVLDRVRNDVSQFQHAETLKEQLKAGGSAAVNTVIAPLRVARAIQERLDIGNRIGLKAAGERSGMTGAKAGSNAAEAGIDYTNGPASSLVQWWSSMVPFMRPALLYSENALKAIERNPAAYAAYATAAVTIPKVVMFALNMMADKNLPDDEKYTNLPTWEKLYYTITPPIMGQRLKLRMPASSGFPFGAVPEAVMQGMYEHDPAKFMDLATAFAREYLPPFVPPAVQAPLEDATNVNLDTWQPLTPSSMTGRSPELQYTPNTSAPAKLAARLLGPPLRSVGLDTMSPIQMDHMVTGWTGPAGQLLLKGLNVAMGQHSGPLDVAELPFVHGFFLTHPGLNGQIIEDYYSEKAKFDTLAADKTGLKQEVLRGDTSNLQLAGEAVRYAQADSRLNAISHVLSLQRDALYGIQTNPKMSDDEKRQLSEQVIKQSLDLAHAATESMRNFDKAASQ